MVTTTHRLQNAAHIIVDFQNDFVKKDGTLSVKAESLGPTVRSLMEACKKATIDNITTQDRHPANHSSFASSRREEPTYTDGSRSDHCVAGTPGAELHESIKGLEDHTILKGRKQDVEEYSGFANGELHVLLTRKNIDTVLISGVATDYCVEATAMDALMLGYKVIVVEDAIKGVNEQLSKQKIENMKLHGIQFETSQTIIEELSHVKKYETALKTA